MKKYLITLCVILGSSLFPQTKGFGLGVILGTPSGIIGKICLSKKTALVPMVAWDYWSSTYKIKDNTVVIANDRLHLSMDVDFHYYPFKIPKGELPWYWGIGGRVIVGNNFFRIGPRIPIGLIYQFPKAPVDIFIETALVIDIIPVFGPGFNGGLGARYFFKKK